MTQWDLETRRVTSGGEFPSRDQLTAYGELSFLFMRASTYANRSADLMRAAIEPAIDTGQFAIMRADGVPRGAYTYAFLSGDAERRMILGERLTSTDWMSGRNLWVMESVAPYSGFPIKRMVKFWHATLKGEVMQYQYVRPGRGPEEIRHTVARRQPNGLFGAKTRRVQLSDLRYQMRQQAEAVA